MRLFRNICWILVAVALVAGTSCKKTEEEDETSQTMTGTVTFDVPYYVLKGETVTLTASGIIYPEDVMYRWYISGIYTDSLYFRTVTVQFPDSLGVFQVSGIALANDFYVSSSAISVTTIDTTWNTSLTGLTATGQAVVDDRDGKSYRYVTLGGLDWFSQNLAWQGTGFPFKASKATAPLFGSMYTWEDAVHGDVCPEGWRVPSNEDWESLAAAMNGGVALPFIDNWTGLGVKASAEAYINGDRMWPYSPDNAHTNTFGWDGLPLGYTYGDGSTYMGMNNYGCWWSSSEKDGSSAFYRYIWYDRGDFPMSYTGKSDMRINVRCVRTHPQS